MAASYARHVSTKQTPQSQPIPGKPMVENSAGGFTFVVDNWTRLDRFLVLGNDGGTYYASEQKLTVENAKCVLACASLDAARTVARIVEISEAGRAPKNDPAIFALALIASQGEPSAKALALAAMPRVCRIGTHFFSFAAACQQLRGWGRGLRRAVGNWYLGKSPEDVAFQVLKYQQRNGWAHRDLLRLAHPKAEGATNEVLHWAVKGWPEVGEQPHPSEHLARIWAFERLKRSPTKDLAARFIRDYGLMREMIPTELLTEVAVWDALLEKMPLTAMIRNLATMTRVGLLTPLSAAVGKVLTELVNGERLRKSRVHPVAVLAALLTYQSGHGERGKHTWTPVSQVVDALDGAFYAAFGNVEPTGKRWLLALDVSGSMDSGTIASVPGLTPRVGTAALALVTAAVEPQHAFVAFTSNGYRSAATGRSRFYGMSNGQQTLTNDGLTPLSISPRQRLDDVCRQMAAMPMGGTDCALPMLYATEQKLPVDAFVVLTDNETWHGAIHPCQALQQYRQKIGIPAKLIVVGMTATGFSIADPADAGQMDVVGFDTSVPAVMADFVR